MDIFAEIKKLDFPQGQYIVVGSAIMAAKSIRGTNDLDIIVTQELFERHRTEGWELLPWTKPGISGKDWLRKGSIELYVQLSRKKGVLTLDELLEDSEVIQGIPFITLEQLIEFKREYGRPKDF